MQAVEDLTPTLTNLLDSTLKRLQSGDVHGGLSSLMEGLWTLRESMTKEQWLRLIRAGRRHELCLVLRQDPMTDWAYSRPRGYPGDAVLLDHTYELSDLVETRVAKTSSLGRDIYRWLVTHSGIVGLKERRLLISQLLDQSSERVESASVVSIACGHGRELSFSKAIRARSVRFMGLDQDAASLRLLSSEYGDEMVATRVCTVKELLQRSVPVPSCDFVYSMGLFDYLPDNLAETLLSEMITIVKPGGMVLIANGLEGVIDTGYMEMFMDWHLIYRKEGDLPKLLSRTPQGLIDRYRTFTQPTRHFSYLEVHKSVRT